MVAPAPAWPAETATEPAMLYTPLSAWEMIAMVSPASMMTYLPTSTWILSEITTTGIAPAIAALEVLAEPAMVIRIVWLFAFALTITLSPCASRSALIFAPSPIRVLTV